MIFLGFLDVLFGCGRAGTLLFGSLFDFWGLEGTGFDGNLRSRWTNHQVCYWRVIPKVSPKIFLAKAKHLAGYPKARGSSQNRRLKQNWTRSLAPLSAYGCIPAKENGWTQRLHGVYHGQPPEKSDAHSPLGARITLIEAAFEWMVAVLTCVSEHIKLFNTILLTAAGEIEIDWHYETTFVDGWSQDWKFHAVSMRTGHHGTMVLRPKVLRKTRFPGSQELSWNGSKKWTVYPHQMVLIYDHLWSTNMLSIELNFHARHPAIYLWGLAVLDPSD